MRAEEHNAIVKALAVVCEITGTSLSEAAQLLMLKQLGQYAAPLVIKALERCASECKFKLTLADVISRIDDGRLGAETAWSLFPKREEDAGLVTPEMSVAWGAAAPLYRAGDAIAARMAFKETYEAEVRKARAENRSVDWAVSPGFDKASTESVAIDGYKRGLLTERQATQYVLPERLGEDQRRLESDNGESAKLARKLLTHWQEKAEEKE